MLELGQHLLVSAASAHEVPQRLEAEGVVGGDGGVLPVAVVGIEQVELVVLGTFMANPLAVDGDAHEALPGFQPQRGVEAFDLGGDVLPATALVDQRLEPDPLVERHLDRVAGPALEPGEDFGPEKRAVEPHLGHHAFELMAGLRPQIAQERQAGLAVVDVAGPVLHPQQVTGLRQMRGDRVVALVLPVMRVITARPEAPCGPPCRRRRSSVGRVEAAAPRARPVPH